MFLQEFDRWKTRTAQSNRFRRRNSRKNCSFNWKTRKETQEVPFETVKEEAIKTATYYSTHEVYSEAATQLIVNAMKGVPISQAPSSYREILINLTQALKDLEN